MFPEDLPFTAQPGSLQFLLAAGVALAAASALGPISILTIQRAMFLGSRRAFWPTLGAVTADGIFGVVAALGSGYLTSAIMGNRVWLRLIGTIILVAMGLKLYSHHRMDRDVSRESFGSLQLGLLNFTLVLSNPLTLAFYLAAFAVLGLRSEHLFAGQSLTLGAGVVSGSLAWFSFVCIAAGRFRLRVGGSLLRRFRMAVGVLFVLLGLAMALITILGR